MELIEASKQEFSHLFDHRTPIFNTATFNHLNRKKVEQVKYLLFTRNKVRAGLIVGIRDQRILSPFSAPFGGFSFAEREIRVRDMVAICETLSEYAHGQDFKEIDIIIPPGFYDESLITKTVNGLFLCKFEVSNIDLNFHLDLSLYDEKYAQRISRGARKNLRISAQEGLSFRECASLKEKQSTYAVIQANREAKGYPLRMTYDQVIATTELVSSKFFVVERAGKPIAAAIIFEITKKIVQVIYWGDLPGHTKYKPINFLSNQVFKYYKDRNMDAVDIGPSTENSIPNYGLCEFKESIGCLVSPKFSFRKVLS